MAGDRTLEASDRWFAAATVGTTGRVRSGRFNIRSVADLREFDPNGYFLSGAYKYNPTGHLSIVELRKHTKGVDTPF